MHQSQHDVLKKLDQAKFSMFHVVTIVVAGMGFFADAYDLFVISFLTKLLGRLYYPNTKYFSPSHCQSIGLNGTLCGCQYDSLVSYLNTTLNQTWTESDALAHVPSAMPSSIDSTIKGMALVGTLLGQITFGILGDKYGRKKIYGVTLTLMIIAAICSGLSFGTETSTIIGTLCFFRLILGFGIGGDYPLSAVIMSEYSSQNRRGQYVAAVFAQQGTGILFAGLMALIVSACFRSHQDSVDYLWRIILIIGAIPAALTMYFRLMMPETMRFTLLVEGNIQKATTDFDQVMKKKRSSDPVGEQKVANSDIVSRSPIGSGNKHVENTGTITLRQFLNQYGRQLIGCALSWGLLDIAYYSSNLFQPDVYRVSGWVSPDYQMTMVDEVFALAKAQIIVSLVSTIPGYWVTVATIEKMGRLKIQYLGFILMTILMAILAGVYHLIINRYVGAFIVLYALCFFFSNWGPNSTTFIIPSELFPARWRSTGHGISSATGKLGAIIGAFGFGAIHQKHGLQTCLICLTVVNFLGMLCTILIPETKGKSLEEMSGETDEAKKISITPHLIPDTPITVIEMMPLPLIDIDQPKTPV